MLRFLYGDELANFPKLSRTMFQDRARQFHTRLGWDVAVDDTGSERDAYDDLNPLYVIWERPDGAHGGSMRFLPTTGDTMVNDHFLHLTDGVRIMSPAIWECTRFCLAPDAPPRISAALMLGGLEIGLGFGLAHSVGVFDRRMVRIYRLLRWPPTIVGTAGEGRDAISVGLWEFLPERRPALLERAGISGELSRHWYTRAFGPKARMAA